MCKLGIWQFIMWAYRISLPIIKFSKIKRLQVFWKKQNRYTQVGIVYLYVNLIMQF